MAGSALVSAPICSAVRFSDGAGGGAVVLGGKGGAVLFALFANGGAVLVGLGAGGGAFTLGAVGGDALGATGMGNLGAAGGDIFAAVCCTGAALLLVGVLTVDSCMVVSSDLGSGLATSKVVSSVSGQFMASSSSKILCGGAVVVLVCEMSTCDGAACVVPGSMLDDGTVCEK